MNSDQRCPCGTGESYGACCQPLHSAQGSAATATILMRSRFAAFAVGDTAYLLRTWHPSTRPASLQLDEQQRWTHLDVIDAVDGGLFDQSGIVEFRAHYRQGRQRATVHERSRFTRTEGAWYYLDGQPGRL